MEYVGVVDKNEHHAFRESDASLVLSVCAETAAGCDISEKLSV